jgi:hypothetical protein
MLHKAVILYRFLCRPVLGSARLIRRKVSEIDFRCPNAGMAEMLLQVIDRTATVFQEVDREAMAQVVKAKVLKSRPSPCPGGKSDAMKSIRECISLL